MSSAVTEAGPARSNEPYRHLEDREEILWGLHFRQLVYVLLGAVVGIVFGLYVSPLPAQFSLAIAIIIGGLPVVLSLVASNGELAPWTVTYALWRWWRSPKLYIPGANPVPGYHITESARAPAQSARGWRSSSARAARGAALSTTPAAQSAAPAAGDLLDVVALDRTGTLVRSDGTLVRYYELIPQNPEVLAEDQQEVMIDGLGRALGALRAGETLQIYAVAAPIQLPELLTQLKQRLTDCLDTQPADRACAYRELAGAYEQTLRRRTIDNAAVRLRIYLIVPFSPENVSARVDWKSQLPGARRIKARAGVSRALTEHAQACRQAEVHADSVCHELEALGFTAIPLAGGEVAELIYRRLNPSTTTRALIPRLQITGELDAIVDAGEAAAAAQQLRAQLADSPISFTDGRQVAIEEDLEQTIYVSSVAETTPLGWTLEAMKLDRPYVLSMHVHATNRIAERKSASRRYRRLFGLNEGARQRSQTPNPDRLAQEQEAAALLDDMRSRKRTGIYEVSLYQAIREPGPHADPVSLAEAAHRAAQAIQEASEATAKLGAFMQQDLLVSTLPIGLDAGRRQANLARRYVTRHAAASLPVFGSSCGSPLEDGALPFFSARGLQTLEGFNPWDRLFINRLMLVNGLQGSGKTMFGISHRRAAAPVRAADHRARSLRSLAAAHAARTRRRAPVARPRPRARDDQPVGHRHPWPQRPQPGRRAARPPRSADRRAARRHRQLRVRHVRAVPDGDRDP